MATSLAAQLRAIKSSVAPTTAPPRRPAVRPSVIFDPKEAADIDLRTILPIALSALDVLAERDARFSPFRSTLFSPASLDLDREKMPPRDEEKLKSSVRSYLRLLAGVLHLPAALQTLEYMIRRYLVHKLDMDELVLCAIPYHDSHAFVRIVQLLDLGNNKWGFLEGVKESGAPLTKKVIVQQCIRDKAVLEAFCGYASPTKDFQPPKVVVCFCTMVIVEALGSVPKIDTDIVNRVINFVFDGLNPALKGGRDHKAGALMVAGLLATRASLSSKLAHNLVFFTARMAHHDANEFLDLSWLRVSVEAIITLVQTESMQALPKKTLMLLNDVRDFVGVLSGLSQEYNIKKFLSLYLEALIENSSSDEFCRVTLISALETLALKELVEKIVFKVFADFFKLSKSMEQSRIIDPAEQVKPVLLVIDKHYPQELQRSVRKFLETSKTDLKDNDPVFHTFCLMLEGISGMPVEISDSKILLSLEHPKVSVRKTALANLSKSGILKDTSASSKTRTNVQDAILRRLHDDNLSVVQSALSLDGLAGIIDPRCILKSYSEIVVRCIDIINKSLSKKPKDAPSKKPKDSPSKKPKDSPLKKPEDSSLKKPKKSDIAISCLEHLVVGLSSHLINSEEVATIMFPLLLVASETLTVNMKVLELAERVEWPLYSDSLIALDPDSLEQSSQPGSFTSVNMKTIGALSKTLMKDPQTHIPWLIRCSNQNELSKTLFFFIILQALMLQTAEPGNLLKLYKATSHALTLEWEKMETRGVVFAVEVNVEQSWTELMDQILSGDLVSLNVKLLSCIYWCLLKTYMEIASMDSMTQNSAFLSVLDELYIFFAKYPSKNGFKKHLYFLVQNCSRNPFEFLAKYFTEEGIVAEVQIESLRLFGTLCSLTLSERSSIEENSVLQLAFPPLLVPLCSQNKDVRETALNCIEVLQNLLVHFMASRSKNGNDTISSGSISSSTLCAFLDSVLSQRKLILSDVNFLPSYLASLLSSSAPGLLVPEITKKRFEHPINDRILEFILNSVVKFSSYGKLVVLSLLKGTKNNILLVEGVKSLLYELLERRNQHLLGLVEPCGRLSITDIKILCLLLEVAVSDSIQLEFDTDCLIKVLKVDGPTLDDQALVLPCIKVLQNMTHAFYDSLNAERQDMLFGNLVSLFRNDSGDIRNAVRDVLLRTNITCSTVVRFLELILSPDIHPGSVKRVKRNKFLTNQTFGLSQDCFYSEESRLHLLASLLDIISMKKNMEKRIPLLQTLLLGLEKLFSDDWILSSSAKAGDRRGGQPDKPESVIADMYYVRQAILLILKDICDTCKSEQPLKDEFSKIFNMRFLVDCARSTKDVPTRNHVFMLLSSITRISPEWISEHVIDIFTVIGESLVTQSDSYSEHVLEDLISNIAPCWLSKTDSQGELFQIFIKALPEVAEHRRLTIMVFLLRTLGEKCSLGVLVVHLFRQLILRIKECSSECGLKLPSCSTFMREWEYVFASQLYSQYASKIWFPSLVIILEEIEIHRENEEVSLQLYLAMQFILQKLQDTELVLELESGQIADYLQGTLGALMEKVVSRLQFVSVRGKSLHLTGDAVKELKVCADAVLRDVTRWMVPSVYFKVITRLLDADASIKKKALGLLCETVKANGSVHKKHKERRNLKLNPGAFRQMDESATQSFNELCMKMVQLIDCPLDDSDTTVKLPAISSLEVLTKELPSENIIFATCLECVVRHIGSTNLAISACCLRATASLLSLLGSKALSQLPQVMKHTLERAHQISSCPLGKYGFRQNEVHDDFSSKREPLLLSVLVSLEAVVENFAGFLNPYIEAILDLVTLHPEYSSDTDVKLKLKAITVRKLLPQKIPVRLMLKPLMKIYSSALKVGESSLSLSFEMLANLIGVMDKTSISSYHVEIFDHCLMALDLRYQLPETVKNIDMVEQSAIHAIITLTMKLTETMFRPLFIRSLEWAESELEKSESIRGTILDRAISFYKLVNKLIDQHRSLFVPYFKYLIDGSARYLTEDQGVESMPSVKKRKKSKSGTTKASDGGLSPKQWHLRALVLKALYQTFLFDTTDLKFLDSTNFQVLLKPIVCQLVVDPPASLELFSGIPTVEEVDETLVMCLCQMAVTARSDVLWKPLNHEVLMRTRSEKIRARILGLKVVKYLFEQLKEEYLVFLAETIPFLGELLEDEEVAVKTLAQEVLREMETLSGENLKQCL